MKILLVEDEIDLNNIVTKYLKKNGYSVDSVFDGEEALDYLEYGEYDLIILDVMMEEMSGFDFLVKYRSLIDAPIILLTAKDFEKDKLEGLALGADDYLTKPFSLAEIRARIAAHIRREKRERHSRLVDYPISCDLLSKKIFCEDMVVELTNSEYEICELLLKNRNSVFSKEKIYTTIYGYDAEGDSSTTITERVKLIRSKFGKYNIDPIKTIWGVGYQWEIKEV